MELQSLWF